MENKKLLIITDVKGWCYWNNTHEVKKHLSDEFEIDIITQSEYRAGHLKYDKEKYFNRYWMDWANRKIDHPMYLSNLTSHRFELDLRDRSNMLIPKYKAVNTVSKKIYDIAAQRFPNQKFFLCDNGVDPDLFRPNPKKDNGKFTVGFSSKKMGGGLTKDLKGYETILLPLIERMKKYPDIEFLNWDTHYKTAIPHSEMPSVYAKMDCLIVTSYREGSPNSITEASSMSIPCITTDVGVCSQILKPECIIPAYNNLEDIPATLESFEKKILWLRDNRELAKWIGEKNREEILKNWTWKIKSENFRNFFNYQDIKSK